MVQILDCTLRDGGYCNNWQFGQSAIKSIIHNLMEANIDIIETGFIRPGHHESGSAVFSSIEEIKETIYPKSQKALYSVMVEQHNYDAITISPNTGDSVDIIRLTFRKGEWEEAKKAACELKEKGYKVCIQPVGTTSYDDGALLSILNDVNAIKPFAFYLVDTLGIMYRNDLRKRFYLIDNNLSQDICLGFHSHNNLQMSFSNAQEILRLNQKRTIIIDSSCYGMGRGVGNLATELFADYINSNIEQRYSLTPILSIIDKYLMPIYAENRWGYDLPYFLSAASKCHPNYAIYLTRRETIGIEKIEKILDLIPISERSEYNATLIESLYRKMQSYEYDDADSYLVLKNMIGGREVVVLGSGASIAKHKDEIKRISKGKFVICVNFDTAELNADAMFISNEKRVDEAIISNAKQVIATSNIKGYIKDGVILNYSSLLGEGDASDNAGAMLIQALKKIEVKRVYLAGFDGFSIEASDNYAIQRVGKLLDYDTALKKNEDISKQLRIALLGMEYEILTPTKYQLNHI